MEKIEKMDDNPLFEPMQDCLLEILSKLEEISEKIKQGFFVVAKDEDYVYSLEFKKTKLSEIKNG